MPPVAPDDLINQHGRFIEDDPSVALPITIPAHSTPDYEPTGKSKKKKNNKKAKAAKAATEVPPEDL